MKGRPRRRNSCRSRDRLAVAHLVDGYSYVAFAKGWFRGNELLAELLEHRVIKKMDARRASGACGAIVRPAFWRLANIAFFSSGRGDGTYASFFGLVASGKPVQLVIEFKVRNPSDPISVELLKREQEFRSRTR